MIIRHSSPLIAETTVLPPHSQGNRCIDRIQLVLTGSLAMTLIDSKLSWSYYLCHDTTSYVCHLIHFFKPASSKKKGKYALIAVLDP